MLTTAKIIYLCLKLLSGKLLPKVLTKDQPVYINKFKNIISANNILTVFNHAAFCWSTHRIRQKGFADLRWKIFHPKAWIPILMALLNSPNNGKCDRTLSHNFTLIINQVRELYVKSVRSVNKSCESDQLIHQKDPI